MSSGSETAKIIKLFLSYSHKDERLKNRLLSHLSPLRHQGTIESWDDRQIIAGDKWNEEMLKRFNEADIILCLISPNFINSDYRYTVEMKLALEKRELGKVEVIPILLKAVDWQETPFRVLQVIPRDNKPIASRSNKDKAFEEVVREIGKVVDALSSMRNT